MITTAILKAPRFIVENEDTSGDWNKGDVIQFEPDFKGRPIYRIWDDDGVRERSPAFFTTYPYLFRLLEWWEFRKPDEMPEYIKDVDGRIRKVSWLESHVSTTKGLAIRMVVEKAQEWQVVPDVMCFFEPASKDEYDLYNTTDKE